MRRARGRKRAGGRAARSLAEAVEVGAGAVEARVGHAADGGGAAEVQNGVGASIGADLAAAAVGVEAAAAAAVGAAAAPIVGAAAAPTVGAVAAAAPIVGAAAAPTVGAVAAAAATVGAAAAANIGTRETDRALAIGGGVGMTVDGEIAEKGDEAVIAVDSCVCENS
jgi:DNA polymerase III subunit gamma/tau